jgi:hypothetical protein
MIVYRVFPRDPGARADQPGGPLWWPRFYQGDSRHDNPPEYACMYASESAVGAVTEVIAAFRNHRILSPRMLISPGGPLAIVTLELDGDAEVLDLDRPRVLVEERLPPSHVATHDREITQAYAARIHERHPKAVGLRWWSTLESLWANVTLFDRAQPRLADAPRELTVEDPVVREAADFLGLSPS